MTEVQIYEGASWLAQNIQHHENLQTILQEMDTRRDSLPPGFTPRVFIQFLRGAINEIKRVTALNQALTQALTQALKESNEEGEIVPKGELFLTPPPQHNTNDF